MARRSVYLVAVAVAGTMLAGLALTAVLANSDDSSKNGGDASPQPTATPPIVDSGAGGGQPPAAPSAAPGEPTPVPRADTPTPRRETPAPPPPAPSGAADRTRVLAPIETARVAVLESYPPQYRLQVRAGLPNGCAKPDGFEVTRSGDDIRVAVYNSMPVGNVVCTQVYGTYELSIDLGTAFVSGRQYGVTVNEKALTFVAQ